MSRNRIQFECPAELDRRLRDYSHFTGLGVSEVIRAALAEYLGRHDVPASDTALISASRQVLNVLEFIRSEKAMTGPTIDTAIKKLRDALQKK